MKLLKSKVVIILLVLFFGSDFNGSGGEAKAEIVMSTITGLDLNKVILLVHTQPKFKERLYARTVQQLAKAGLRTSPDQYDANRVGVALLELTVNPEPLDIKCPGKVMYINKLVLNENVFPERNPKLKIWSATWIYGLPEPIVIENITIEKLEADLDALVAHFIESYRLGNSIRNKVP